MEKINIKQETPHFIDSDNVVIANSSNEPEVTVHQQVLQEQIDIEKKKNTELSEENDALKKRVHELEQIWSCAKRRSSDIDILLDHKRVFVGQMHYLIRWKNSCRDTWQNERNLECAHLLEQYKKERNIL